MGNSDSTFANQAFKAVRTGNERKLQQLLGGKKARNVNVQDSEGLTLLSLAVQYSNPGICNLLINSGANTNMHDARGLTPLHKAVTHSFDEKLIVLLLKNGADLDFNQNEYKRTPLIEAVYAGNERMAELLINNGADVNLADRDGLTPLHWAAQTGNEALVRCLLDHQADVNVRDKTNATPLLKARAEDNVHIVKILEKHFCKLYKIDCCDFEEGEAEVGGTEGTLTGGVVADPAAAAAAIIMGWSNTVANAIQGGQGVGGVVGANERHSTSSSSNGSLNGKGDPQQSDKKKKKKKKKTTSSAAASANNNNNNKDKKKKGKKNDDDGDDGNKKKNKKKKKKKNKGGKGKKAAAEDDDQGGVVIPRTKEEELLALDETKHCKICFERPMDTVLLGCGHVAICLFCSQYLQSCPLCSAPIEKVSKIYFS